MDQKISKIQKKVQLELDESRYEHTQGVMYTAAALAMCYGEDVKKAMIAGLLHDCAKCIPTEEKIHMCEDNHLEISAVERKNPSLLHAKLGAFLAEETYKIEDPDILQAIASHTTGRPNMSLLEKILYVADYIEPRRDRAPNLLALRRLAFENLDQALYEIMSGTLEYLKLQGVKADEMTELAWEYYHSVLNQQTKKEDTSNHAECKGTNQNRRQGTGRKKRRGYPNH